MLPTNAEAYGLPDNPPPFVHDRELGGPAKFLIFHIVPLSSDERDELLTRINSRNKVHQDSKLAPNPDFSNRPLRDVYDYFIDLREKDETVQPDYFIVADRVNFTEEGVLGVCLKCSEGGGHINDVGVARCDAYMADCWGANFAMGMAGWEEMKDAEMQQYGDDAQNFRVEPLDAEQKHAKDAMKYGLNHRTGVIVDRDVYAWYSLVENAVPINRMLGLDWLDKTPDECRFQMVGNYHASEDPWADISREHPQHAAFRPRVHRSIVLVAEKEIADQEDGIAIVRLRSGRAPKILVRVSARDAIVEADEWAD